MSEAKKLQDGRESEKKKKQIAKGFGLVSKIKEKWGWLDCSQFFSPFVL